jgi:serine protease inhibitor
MHRRIRVLLVAALGAALLLAATGSTAVGGLPAPPQILVSGQRTAPPPGTPIEATVAGMTQLGYELARAHGAEQDNWLISPLSIAYAFAMLRAGAGGETAAEIDRAFGFPATGLAESFNALTRQVVTADVPPAAPRGRSRSGEPAPPVVCVANGLFPQHGQAIGKPFLDTLGTQYGAGVYPVNFASSDAKRAIDSWVRRQTAGLIRELFNKLSPDTRLVLANTVYLRASWRKSFQEFETTTEPFTTAGGDTVQVPTMHADVDARYLSGPGWQAVELPYHGDLAMRIMLPAATDRGAREALLSPAATAVVAAGLREERVRLALPRWTFSTVVNLAQELPKLGMPTTFSGAADFAGIAPGLLIDQAVHRTKIIVDEEGTEAAAVTGVAMAVSAPAQPKITVRVDRPFAFAIVHTPTGTPLFTGTVGDPSAE